jgi:hypothetical protein
VDTGALMNLLRRPVTAAGDVARTRIITLNLKLAIDVAAGQAARAELVRELQALATPFPTIRLLLSPGRPAQLQAGPHRFEISAALRDALLATATARAAAPGAAAPGRAPNPAPAAQERPVTAGAAPAATNEAIGAFAPGAARWAASAPAANARSSAASTAHPATVLVRAGAEQALRAAIQWPSAAAANAATAANAAGAASPRHAAGEPAPLRWVLPVSQPMIAGEGASAPVAASQIHAAVRDSGLFNEAQLAQALRDSEPAARLANLREALRTATELPPAERAVMQLDVLRRDALALSLPAWPGQWLRLDLARERVDADAGSGGAQEQTAVFAAVLTLDLPLLGSVQIRLRLLNATLAATVEAADPQLWRDALPELAAALHARGLHAVALQALAPAPEVDRASAA